MLLEICANSYQSARNAQEAGAHRIELCSELSLGGITPHYGLLKQVAEELTIESFVLIRPRSGHFVYSEAEFQSMKYAIELCKDLGYSGIVSGVLHADQTIDIERTRKLIEWSKPLSFTFHRAFDLVPDPFYALNLLKGLGVDRILTSGQQSTAEKGIVVLNELLGLAHNELIILPGSGINQFNALVFKGSGFQEIHASASSEITTQQNLFSENLTYSDPQKIKAILKSISDEV